MTKHKPVRLQNRWWIALLAAAVVLFLILSDRYADLPLQDSAMFLLTQVALVLLPGFALSLRLLPQKTWLMQVLVGYLTGIALVIAQYYLCYALGGAQFLTACLCIVAAMSVFWLWKRRDRVRALQSKESENWVFTLLLCALLVLIFFVCLRAVRLPDAQVRPAYTYYQDMLWNAGNLTSIANGLPVQDLHIYGLTFSYHFFTNVFLAVFQNVLGISAFTLMFKLLGILQIVVYAAGLWLLFSQFLKTGLLKAIAVAVCVFASAVFLEHMAWNMYTSLFSLGMTAAAAAMFLRYCADIESKPFWRGELWGYLILLAVSLGTKTLFTAVLLGGVGLLALVWILRRKQVLKMLGLGILTLAMTGALFALLVMGTHTYNALSIELFTPLFAYEPAYFGAMKAAGLSGGVASLLAYPIFLAQQYPLQMLAIVLCICALVWNKKFVERQLVLVFLLGAILSGIGAATLLMQPGYSNVLFVEATLPFAVFAIFYAGKTLHNKQCALSSLAKKIWFGVMIAAMVFAVWQGICVAQKNLQRLKDYALSMSPTDSIAVGEYEAMIWIRDNTPRDAIVAGDRFYFAPNQEPYFARYYYYSAFAERQMYLEGYFYANAYEADFEERIAQRLDTVTRAYNGDAQAVEQLAAEGVDYMITTAATTPNFLLDDAQVVFQNDAVWVYGLQK